MFVQMMCSKPSNILFPNLVLWFIIISPRSRSQQNFKMSMSVCPDIFWIPESFTTKLVYGHTSLWARLSFKKIGLLSSRSRSQSRIIQSKFDFLISELLILLQVNLVWWHIIIRWIVLWKDWFAVLCSRARSQKRFRIPVNFHLVVISSAAEPSVIKLGMVMQLHGPKYHARRLVSCLQDQDTVRAHLIKYECFYHICWTHLFATKFGWYVIISWSTLYKN